MMATENATMCRVSDNEMSYFQRRAREMLLLRREDHAWKEFCRTCTTCVCSICREATAQTEKSLVSQQEQNLDKQKDQKPIIAKNMPSANNSKSDTLKALNEIKTKLEHIDLALSKKGISENTSQIFPEMKQAISFGQTGNIENPANVQRMELIEKCLKQSVQRLQSSAALISARSSPQPPVKKSRGYFLPHELQHQRAIARNAYLASLSKSKSTLQPSRKDVKGKKASNRVDAQDKVPQTRVIPKTRPKSTILPKSKEVAKEVETSQSKDLKDQNIEIAAEGIIDDLMGETVLLLNRIKQIKSRNSNIQTEQANEEFAYKIPSPAIPAQTNSGSLHNWAKIRQTLFNLNPSNEERSSSKHLHFTPQDNGLEPSKHLQNPSQSSLPQTSESFSTDAVIVRRLVIDPQTSSSIERHRKDYAKYLEKVARAKKGSFDSCTLANMISEFLLDECINSVSNELVNVPSTLIADLCEQEFLQSL